MAYYGTDTDAAYSDTAVATVERPDSAITITETESTETYVEITLSNGDTIIFPAGLETTIVNQVDVDNRTVITFSDGSTHTVVNPHQYTTDITVTATDVHPDGSIVATLSGGRIVKT